MSLEHEHLTYNNALYWAVCETYYGITYIILLSIVQTSLSLVILSWADIRIVRGQLEYVTGLEK